MKIPCSLKALSLLLCIFLNSSIEGHWKVAITGPGSAEVINEFEKKYKNSNITFIDRTDIDSKLMESNEPEIAKELESKLKSDFYDLVFFMPTRSSSPKPKRQKLSDSKSLKEKYNAANYKTIIDVPVDSAANQAKFIENTTSDRFLIGNIMDCFAGKNNNYKIKSFMGPIRLIEVNHKGDQLKFFGVHVDRQKDINFAELKKKLLSYLNIKNKKLVQVVGDSGRDVFSKEGAAFARNILEDRFQNCGIIEYGYTGYSHSQGYDVNSIVNEYIDNHPEVGNRVIANIVGHIHIALNKWGCYASPYVKNFVVVYNDYGMTVNPVYDTSGNKIKGFTVFSEDTTMSDYMLQAKDGDVTISLEGGTQCWKQVINMLDRSIHAELIYNIRIPNKQHHFSVARILKQFYDKKPQTEQQAQQVANDYQKSLEHLWDTTRQDNSEMNYGETKKKLLRDSMNDLIKGGLYMRVPDLCSFYDAKK